MPLESKELMALCLRKIPGLAKVKLVDAVWIWTEPHSLRLKIKVTVQKEVVNGAILQQADVIEFTIRNQQCKTCEASYAQGAWHAIVQVRQRVRHKRTFFFLEQLLLKQNAHSECIRIMTFRDGMDFYFLEKQNAARFLDFLEGVIPIESKYARKLVSADNHSNTANYKHNYGVTIAPICKDDLVVLPRKLAQNCSNISPLVLVKAITAEIQVLDPLTCERQSINSEKYFRHEFESVMNSRDLVRFVVLSCEPVLKQGRPGAKKRGAGTGGGKMRLGECVVARERDFGTSDQQFTVVTHLGNLLREGDIVLGYDLTVASWTEDTEVRESLHHGMTLPDVVLVRKYYETKGERSWYLNKLEGVEVEADPRARTEDDDEEYENFLQQVEADREMRSQMKVYGKNKKPSGAMVIDSEDAAGAAEGDTDDERIKLEDLISEMEITPPELSVLTAEEGAAIAPSAEAASLQAAARSDNAFSLDDAKFEPGSFRFL